MNNVLLGNIDRFTNWLNSFPDPFTAQNASSAVQQMGISPSALGQPGIDAAQLSGNPVAGFNSPWSYAAPGFQPQPFCNPGYNPWSQSNTSNGLNFTPFIGMSWLYTLLLSMAGSIPTFMMR